MNQFTRLMGKVCDNCPLCKYARENPDAAFGKVMEWHGKWCPAWKAQKEIAKERNEGKHS
jgi:hypothetical protein